MFVYTNLYIRAGLKIYYIIICVASKLGIICESACFAEYKGYTLYTCAYITIFNRIKCNIRLSLYNNIIRVNLRWLNNTNNNTIWYYYFTTLRPYLYWKKKVTDDDFCHGLVTRIYLWPPLHPTCYMHNFTTPQSI